MKAVKTLSVLRRGRLHGRCFQPLLEARSCENTPCFDEFRLEVVKTLSVWQGEPMKVVKTLNVLGDRYTAAISSTPLEARSCENILFFNEFMLKVVKTLSVWQGDFTYPLCSSPSPHWRPEVVKTYYVLMSLC